MSADQESETRKEKEVGAAAIQRACHLAPRHHEVSVEKGCVNDEGQGQEPEEEEECRDAGIWLHHTRAMSQNRDEKPVSFGSFVCSAGAVNSFSELW